MSYPIREAIQQKSLPDTPQLARFLTKLDDGLALTDEDLVRLRTSTEDHFVERKSFGDWKKDAVKTVVAFANSVPIGQPAFLFIGVKDNAEVERALTNLDAVQKTFADLLRQVYPRIPYIAKGLMEGDRAYLVVIVHGSVHRPHFAGPSYVREGSQTREASEEQFRELIAQQQSKVRELLKWKGKIVTLETVTNRISHMSPRRLPKPMTVESCNQFYVTLSGDTFRRSLPLNLLELSFDDTQGQLKIEYYP